MPNPSGIDEDDAALRFTNSVPGAAMCTIVKIDGSFSRRLGAQLSVAPDGRIVGSLSDGCLEHELATQARGIQGQGPKVLRYGKGSPFIDFRLPCGSGLDVLVDPSPNRRHIAHAVEELDARRPGILPIPVEKPGVMTHRTYLPRPKLLIFGTGPEMRWLTKFSIGFGYECRSFEPRTELALCRDPSHLYVDAWTAIILLFHDHEWEEAILEWALSTSAMYIGAIGGAVARERRSALLFGHGRSDADVNRIRSPIGLIKSARDPRVMAISILAEIIETYEGLRP